MIYDWYKIFNLTEFLALGLTSKNYTVILSGLGARDILVTQGNEVSVLFDDVFLSIGLDDQSPFAFEERAVFKDTNDDVWVGILNED